jgi:hypothetical protein
VGGRAAQVGALVGNRLGRGKQKSWKSHDNKWTRAEVAQIPRFASQ